MSQARRTPRTSAATTVLGSGEASLLDIVDNVLSKGVVLTGELTLALAHVDLVYARLSLLLCAADRVLPNAPVSPRARSRPRATAPARPPTRRGA